MLCFTFTSTLLILGATTFASAKDSTLQLDIKQYNKKDTTCDDKNRLDAITHVFQKDVDVLKKLPVASLGFSIYTSKNTGGNYTLEFHTDPGCNGPTESVEVPKPLKWTCVPKNLPAVYCINVHADAIS